MSLRTLFLIMFVIFVVSLILGVIGALYLVSLNPNQASSIGNTVKQLYGDIPIKFYSIDMSLYIFRRNLLVVTISVVMGLLVFIPGAIVFINGFIVGLVTALTAVATGTPFLALIAIVPHGILELPAIFMSTAFGTKLGIDFWKYILKKNREELPKTLKMLPKILLVVIVLLLAASLIETFITPYIVFEILKYGT